MQRKEQLDRLYELQANIRILQESGLWEPLHDAKLYIIKLIKELEAFEMEVKKQTQKTNLDHALQYFKKAVFTSNNTYELNKEFTIVWLGDGELFCVDRHYYDNSVGYVTDYDVYDGDFMQCLDYVKQKCGIA